MVVEVAVPLNRDEGGVVARGVVLAKEDEEQEDVEVAEADAEE